MFDILFFVAQLRHKMDRCREFLSVLSSRLVHDNVDDESVHRIKTVFDLSISSQSLPALDSVDFPDVSGRNEKFSFNLDLQRLKQQSVFPVSILMFISR